MLILWNIFIFQYNQTFPYQCTLFCNKYHSHRFNILQWNFLMKIRFKTECQNVGLLIRFSECMDVCVYNECVMCFYLKLRNNEGSLFPWRILGKNFSWLFCVHTYSFGHCRVLFCPILCWYLYLIMWGSYPSWLKKSPLFTNVQSRNEYTL